MIKSALIATGKKADSIQNENDDEKNKKYINKMKNPAEWWDEKYKKVIENRKEKMM